MRNTMFRWLALVAAAGLASSAVYAGFADPMHSPAITNPRAAHEPVMAVAQAGQRLVAVGPRGVILVSDDDAAHWRQVNVPVSADLVAVTFKSATLGWAVGHDGEVLHTVDGGNTWTRQLDGEQAAKLMTDYYAKQQGDSPDLKASREEAQRFVADQGGRPFLDVWFDDERSGWVIGSFNIIFHTEDGGKSWVPWFDRVDNPDALNLHAMRRINGTLYIVGEQGLLLKLDPDKQRFVAVSSPSKGSLFGLAAAGNAMVVYGLLGNAYRSTDGGATWSKITLPTGASILASAELPNGRLLLATQAGELLESTDQGATFHTLGASQPGGVFAMALRDDTAVLAGAAGLTRVNLAKSQ
ncbi:YCF48-related protein [Paraburkholderia sp. CNPSo 3274]|uniref:WD40/YVTN/BNR-like repeat-containing protein n=1 Tax=Paraburkholderia sp. CNPSo 3274 TaxID=2940932 RepID=UPI0020B7BEBC|nr:YCF48-related protein [Paraburkholderia sp. CNPSo 3274]MCP3710524.1 YCF48-related protein [Paraburkholderia sp. CNPSo 3274]